MSEDSSVCDPLSIRQGYGTLGECSAGTLGYATEGFGLSDRQVGEHLAIDLDTGMVQSVDEPAVG